MFFKRHFMALLLLAVGVVAQLGAKTTITYKTDGTFVNNATSGWVNSWTSSTTPSLTISASGSGGINAANGYMAPRTFTMTVANGYIITGYDITGRSQLTSGSTTITAGSSSKTFNASDDDSFSVTGLGNNSTSFTISVSSGSSGNQNFKITSIVITVEEDQFTPTASEVYTINNTNTNRGAMMYNSSSSYVWSSGKSGTFDATSPNCQWVLYPTATNGLFYLYNVGAGKFAIPSSTSSTASWVFSSNAVAVAFITQSDGTKKIKTATTDTYAAVSNTYAGPIINYNDVGGNFTITKVDGDQSTAANAAVAKLVDNVTPLSAIPDAGTSDWYIIRIKTHGTYADKYIYPAASEINYNGTNYALTFDHGANIRPAIDDVSYYTRIIRVDNKAYWQLPSGKYLYGTGNKFPVSTFAESTFSIAYVTNNGITLKGDNRYAVPYYLGSKYFIGETSNSGNAYYDIYPINLTTAGLTAWKVVLDGLDASTLITCTRSDVSGLTSVYTNGYFFLPTNASVPVEGEFTVTIGTSTVTLNATVDTEEKTINLSLPVLTINSPMAEASFTWNGESKTGKSVTFINTGSTISDPTITVTYTGNVYTSPTLSLVTWDGTESATVTCTMTPAFFSTNYGDKWVRLQSAKTTNLVVYLTGTSAGSSAKLKTHDYMDESQLWCFVGNSSSFTIYNKAAGEDYVLTSASSSPGQNTTIALQASGSANSTWTLGDKFSSSDAPGYSVYLSGTSGEYGLHGWQSDGTDVKFWGTGSGGSHYLIEDASGEVTLELAGFDPSTMTVYTQNIAVLSSSVAGSSSTKLITKDNFSATSTVYVPVGTELTFETPKLFMNYGFTGYDGDNQSKAVTSTTTPQTVTATFSVVRPDARYLWEPLRTNTSDYYRIPAIVTAKNGDIIAINDRRFDNDKDLGNNSGTAANPSNHHIDIIGVASSDNGKTWNDEFMIMNGTGSGPLAGYGDAAVVADRESNKVLVMACAGNVFYTGQNNSYHQTLQRTVLTHNGTTWVAETPTDVTNQFFAGTLASSNGMFIGSGAISQSKIIKKGDYYRIYCAVLERSNSNFVFYSDDFGLTWTMMGSAAANDNEPKVEELPDGCVLLSVRKSYGRTFNIWTWDDDSYTSGAWGTAVASNNQTGGISFGNNSTNGDIRIIPAIKKSTGEVVSLAMQSVPTANSRSNVSLYYKEVSAETAYTPTTIAENWSGPFEVTPYSSAYSSFNQQPDGRIAFYMEEAPKSVTGFYMCYVPLTLDEITNDQYTGMASTFDVTLNEVNNKSYATLYLPYDVMTTGTTKAYYIASANNGATQLTATNNDGTEIPANTAVVLVNEDGDASVTLNATAGLEPIVNENDNLLKGTLVPMSLDLSDESNYYALGSKNSKIGFYKFANGTTTSITLGANKAYLETTAASSPARGFVFDIDNPTGIESMDDVQGTMYDERWTMDYEQGTMYDLSGRRVDSQMKHGIYIVNGKKIITK